MKKGIILLISVAVFGSCSKLAKIQKSKDFEYKLKMAEQFYAKKKYNWASQIYEELFPILRTDPRFEDVYYKYASCAFYMRDYLNAQNLYKTFAETFPKSSRIEDAHYMAAFSYYKQSPKPSLDQTNTIKAIGEMQTFVAMHPESPKVKDANDIISKCRTKLEQKDFLNAELYYNLSQYRAAAITFENLLNSYPETEKGDEYKLMVIKSYYQFALLSIEEKQPERYEKVIDEYNDFVDRFPDSKLKKEAERFYTQSKNNLKNLQNEQIKETTKR